jgi:Protein of unknown function (DUF1648)
MMSSMSEWVLLLLDGVFIVHLLLSARRLPDRIASHFLASGVADGWLSRRVYLTIFAVMGPGLSIIYLGLLRAFPNPPMHALMQHVAWGGCLMLAFIFGVHLLTVKANCMAAGKLSMPRFWSLLGALQLGILIWVLTFPS